MLFTVVVEFNSDPGIFYEPHFHFQNGYNMIEYETRGERLRLENIETFLQQCVKRKDYRLYLYPV